MKKRIRPPRRCGREICGGRRIDVKMKELVVYLHGMGGSAAESEHYKPLFAGADVIGFDYKAQTPWEAKTEFPPFFANLRKKYGRMTLVANSIGAYFAMHALADEKPDLAFLISPVADMENLITGMMAAEGVTESELRRRGVIPVRQGGRLSWEYLCYARCNPLYWDAPTHILYGENDALVPFSSVAELARRTGAELTVMPGGGHWFHTPEQMRFLDEWIKNGLV